MLISEEDESLLETLELLSIPGFKDSMELAKHQVKKGETYSVDEVFDDEV